MMKKIVLILLMITGIAYGQTMPADSNTSYIHYPYAKGIWYPKGIFDRQFVIPNDTIYSKYGIAFKSNTMYRGDGVKWNAISGAGGGVTDVAGTTNRVTSTGGATPVIDISAVYVGQASITTLGTVTTGTIGSGAIVGKPTMTLGSDADGDIYYRASGVLTRLSKGTSSQILHSGTVPVWKDTTAAGVTDSSLFVTNTHLNTSLLTKEDTFTETVERFTSSTSLTVTVANTPKTTKVRMVFFNGIEVDPSYISITGSAFTISGITRETDDVITVKYSY